MNTSEFGPFANVVAIACALVATFSLLLLKAFGKLQRWTWLTSDSPPFLVTAGVRALAVALMAATYVTISQANRGWFVAAAVLSGLAAFVVISRFDRLRRVHVRQITEVGATGQALRSKGGKEVQRNVVVGLEKELMPHVVEDLKEARVRRGGLSLEEFMRGYGTPVNMPSNLWDGPVLAQHANSLTTHLMYALLFGVMALFFAAFVIEVSTRTPAG